MEPSLRSSTLRGVECKLRRTDPALHESMKRFVESLCPDVRISQYTDLNFAAKRMEHDTWYWLEPLAGGKVGYLIFLPDQPVIWIDDQFKQSFKIQMRVSCSIYQKHSIMIASLNKTDCMLRLEDAWLLSGTSLLDHAFTQRWNLLLDFYSDYYKEELKLQQGLRIVPASYSPLHAAKAWSSTESPAMMFAQGEKAPRRLRVQFHDFDKKENNKAIVPPFFYAEQEREKTKSKPAPTPTILPRPLFVEEESCEGVAKAVPHDEFPDTYNITINGVKKGFAAVQDILLSRILREATKGKKEVLVKVEWNDEFRMYQILSQL